MKMQVRILPCCCVLRFHVWQGFDALVSHMGVMFKTTRTTTNEASMDLRAALPHTQSTAWALQEMRRRGWLDGTRDDLEDDAMDMDMDMVTDTDTDTDTNTSSEESPLFHLSALADFSEVNKGNEERIEWSIPAWNSETVYSAPTPPSPQCAYCPPPPSPWPSPERQTAAVPQPSAETDPTAADPIPMLPNSTPAVPNPIQTIFAECVPKAPNAASYASPHTKDVPADAPADEPADKPADEPAPAPAPVHGASFLTQVAKYFNLW